MIKSRLKKRLKRQLLKNLLFSVLGIIVIIYLLIKFGIPLLVNLTLFISGEDTNQKTNISQESLFLSPPILNTEYTATNSAKIIINGTSNPNQTVAIYNNGNLADKVSVNEKGEFTSTILLKPDENTVKAKTISSDRKESGFSEKITIFYSNSPPFLVISSPADGETFNKDRNIAEVRGKTDSQIRVTVNDFWATIDNNNEFYYRLNLDEGLNEILITAVDQAGNKTEKKLKVTYYP